MSEQGSPRGRSSSYLIVEGATWLGRLLGLVIVGIALAVSSNAAGDATNNEVWVFLDKLVTPMGIGFLILVGAEAMSRLGRQ